MIEALPWVADGQTTDEEWAVSTLLDIHARSPQVFSVLVRRPWLRDDLNNPELQVTLKIADILARDPAGALSIAAMPFLDTLMGSEEMRMLKWLRDLSWEPRHLRALLTHPDLAGGIDDDDDQAVVRIILELQNPTAAAKVNALPWVQDGVDDSESAVLHEFRRAARSYAQSPLFDILLDKAWVRDALSWSEYGALYWLLDLSFLSESAAVRLADMPFMASVDHWDYLAVLGLYGLRTKGPEHLSGLLSHPALADGITDDQAVVIALLRLAPELLDVLLDPEQTIVETRPIEPPLGGEILLSVVWPGNGATVTRASRTMDLVEHAVRTQEEFMGVPYPMRHAAVLVADIGLFRGGGGFMGDVYIHPPYFEDYALIAHEIAHTYWNVPPVWLQEGPARFLEFISVRERTGDPLPEPQDSCGSFESLLELEQAPPQYEICNYTLGTGLFLDLYSTLGDEAFRQGFARLYEGLRDRNRGDQCPSADWSACSVKAAFMADATPEHAAAAEAIINRRYYGADN